MNRDEDTPWQYKPDGGQAPAKDSPPDDAAPAPSKPSKPKTIAWQASEYIEHHHGAGWFLALAAVTAGLAALVYIVAKDKIAAGFIVILGVIVAVFASHKPDQARYEITAAGLSVNDKIYRYGDYKSFAVIREGALNSVNLFPLKRFMPPVSAYFEPADESKIVDALGNYLPYEERRLDAIDRLSRRLRL